MLEVGKGLPANEDRAHASITAEWSAIGLPAGSATVRDLWSHTDLGTFTGSYTANGIPSHGVAMLKIAGSRESRDSAGWHRSDVIRRRWNHRCDQTNMARFAPVAA
jgi:hypothetical protein